MDYRIYHAINDFVARHDWLGTGLADFEKWIVPVLAALVVGLWLLARPGGSPKWKLASVAALAAAGLALLLNQGIAQLWDRARPFAAHPDAHVWGSRSHDPSFPSDHSSAAFAIAFAVLLFDRVAGAWFLALAAVIGVGRVAIGDHYPSDVLAGVGVGLVAALVVGRLALPILRRLVALVQRVTDPVLARFWAAWAR